MFRKPTIEQLGEFIAPTMQALLDGARYVDERLRGGLAATSRGLRAAPGTATAAAAIEGLLSRPRP